MSELQPNGIYIMLFLRSDVPERDNFHWALYHHHDPETATGGGGGGHKYHIKGSKDSWLADHGHTQGVLKAFLLVGLFHICTVPAGLETHVDTTLRQYDGVLNDDPAITCRVWLLRVLAKLQEPVSVKGNAGCRILSADMARLEREALDFGNLHAQSAIENLQPRPIGRSEVLGEDGSGGVAVELG
ncbi:hypothetical protein EJ05DRAFT_475269 [Pseudovirgaria hyperparasitica]|uniref:Uncharacterized protein n=1 Tax=Pseudovirgaria hyperparasitica TaxID=470096 RepID=A0A6A6WAR0_9PEZI|nr:uncharacterized protein EJ05DRAFT_475269 [Pseudovirgaria hyperparasitica]KAF2759040.1 hypothetical protein EJ05DRAFT_475269 [Pseudovirgaria hyperparasitica]